MAPRRAWTVVVAAFTAFLVIFAVVGWAQVPVLADPRSWLDSASAVAAAVGIALLVVDAVVPVPSSVVMVALGATFGVTGGVALSVIGSVGGFALGFLLGRRSTQPIAAALYAAERQRAAQLVSQWGVLAVVVSRPLPLIAETVAFTSGAFGMRTLPALVAALVGGAGPAAVYAYAGSKGASGADSAGVFAVVAVVAGISWVAGRRFTATGTPT